MKKVLFIVLATTILGWVSPMKAEDAKGVEIKTYTYAIKGKDTLRVDVYLREDMQNAENLPMMLYVHGGGFSMGSRKNAAQEIFLRHFAEKGFLGASIDYRLGLLRGILTIVTVLQRSSGWQLQIWRKLHVILWITLRLIPLKL